MSFNTDDPIPEDLLRVLNIVLKTKDHGAISGQIKDENAAKSVPTIRGLLDGSAITENTLVTVIKIVNYATAKNNKIINTHLHIDSILKQYQIKADADRP